MPSAARVAQRWMRMARGVVMQRPDMMFESIDARDNKSKFYEMRVVRYGLHTQAQKEKDHTAGRPAWTLERRWGRLTDSGKTGRVDSFNEHFADERGARAAMVGHARKRRSRGYTDVTDRGTYSIGLGGAGFGWGGQAVCRVIPELKELEGHISEALELLAPIAREDSEVAAELRGMLIPVRRFLQDHLRSCR